MVKIICEVSCLLPTHHTEVVEVVEVIVEVNGVVEVIEVSRLVVEVTSFQNEKSLRMVSNS